MLTHKIPTPRNDNRSHILIKEKVAFVSENPFADFSHGGNVFACCQHKYLTTQQKSYRNNALNNKSFQHRLQKAETTEIRKTTDSYFRKYSIFFLCLLK